MSKICICPSRNIFLRYIIVTSCFVYYVVLCLVSFYVIKVTIDEEEDQEDKEAGDEMDLFTFKFSTPHQSNGIR